MTRRLGLALLLAALAPPAGAAPFRLDDPLAGRTVCGKTDWTPVADENVWIQRMGRPVGLLVYRTGAGTFACTGTLVSTDLFLTARHCEAVCDGSAAVTFGYLSDGGAPEEFACREIVEKGGPASEDDYQLLRLAGSPGVAWGWHSLSDAPLTSGRGLRMLHHPAALPLRLSSDECKVTGTGKLLRHRCDTEGGSSGGALFRRDATPWTTRIVGIHTLGGCDESPKSGNYAVSIANIARKSALIRRLIR